MNLLPTSSFCLLLLSIAFVNGCNDTEVIPDDDVNDTVAVSEVTEVELVQESENDFTIAELPSVTINDLLYSPLIQSDKLSSEQIACLEMRDNEPIIQRAQDYFDESFTADELKALNNFYGSDVGKKMIAYNNEQLLRMNGLDSIEPVVQPTQSELMQMQVFNESPVGQKYQQINDAKGEGSLVEALKPLIKDELDRCHIEGVM